MEKKVILIIDDSDVDATTYQRYLRTFLSGEPLEFYRATTGEEALSVYPVLEPDSVLIDYQLPDCDGLWLLEQLQALSPVDGICVVFITGVGSESLAVEALHKGAFDYLVKQEVTQERLGKAIQNAMARYQLRQQVTLQQQQLLEMNQQLQQYLAEMQKKEATLLESTEKLKQINQLLSQSQQHEQQARAEAERQQKTTENTLLQIQALLQAATEVAIIATDAQGTITLFNPGAEKMLGYSAQEVVGNQTPDLFHLPAEIPSLEVLLAQSEQTAFGLALLLRQVKKGTVNVGEWTYRTKKGTHKSVQLMVNGVTNWEGQLDGYLCIATDITEQKQAKFALEKNIRRVQQILNFIPHLIWCTNMAGTCTFLNQKWQEYVGLNVANPAEFNFISLVHADDRQHILDQREFSLITGQPFEAQFRLRDSQGEYRWMLGRTIPILNEQGEMVERVGTATDIHEQTMAQHAVEESERRFRSMTNAIPQIVWTANSKGETDYFNERWQAYSGFSSEETIDLGWDTWLHPDDTTATLEAWKESLETGKEFRVEQRLRNQRGEYRWLLSQALPLRNKDGQIVQWFGTSYDIHNEKQYLKQLVEAQREITLRNEQLSRLNVDLDNFVYTASHDLRSPLANLQGLQHLLASKLQGKLSANELPLIGFMGDAIAKLNRLIQDLGTIAHNQQQQEIMTEEVYFREVLQDVEGDIRPLLEETEGQIQSNFEVELFSYPRKYLHSILYNLLTNALKYRFPNRPPVVLVHTSQETNGVYLTVKDNGLGMNAQELEKLFGAFKRFHTHIEGSGIGLYSIKRTIENYKGHITVESEPGEGTAFKVFFKTLDSQP